LVEKLKIEAPGILNLILQGTQRYYAGSIVEPDCVKLATKQYLADKDSVRSFLDFESVRDTSAIVSKTDLYEAYQRYCELETMEALGKKEFGTVVKKLGHEDTRDRHTRSWKGLRLGQPGVDDVDHWNVVRFAKRQRA
jgi:phage/plasmid-associated DNA primase